MILLNFVIVALATLATVSSGGPAPFIRHPPLIIPWPPVIITIPGGGSGGSSRPNPYRPPRPVVAQINVNNGQTFGSWKTPEFCPFGTYASGFNLKVEKSQGGGLYWGNDDTALNAIALKCKSPENDQYHGRDITSGEGSWGKWKGLKNCRKDESTKYFLTAFQLRVERKRGRKDDTAANNINFKCRPLTRSENYVIAGAGMGWGSYGAWSENCPIGSAICGIRTRVEGKQGSGDDTALNDVTFYCCEHPVATTTVKPTTIKPTTSTTRRVGSIGEIGMPGEVGRRGSMGAA